MTLRRLATLLVRGIPVIVPSVLLVLVLVLRQADPGDVLTDFRNRVFDLYQRIEPRAQSDAPVRIVDIDDETLARLGIQWPWPRTILAQMTKSLADAGAAAIVFDVVFAEPDRTSPASASRIWSLSDDDVELRRMLEALPDHDRLFAEAIAAAGNVVTGFALTPDKTAARPLVRGGFAVAGDDPREFLRGRYSGAVTTLPDLERAAAGNGFMNFAPGTDLVVRSVPLLLASEDGRLHPSLVAEALRVAQGARTSIVKSSGASGETAFGARSGINQVKIGQFVVPTDAQGGIVAHYARRRDGLYIPAWKVLEGAVDAAEFDGTIVLVGTSAAGLRDLRPSPIDPLMPGVEAHAQALEQIMLGHFLSRPDWADGVEWLTTLALGGAMIALLATVGALASAIVGFAAVGGIIAGSWYCYREILWLFDPVFPAAASLAIYLSGSLIGYLRTEAERKQVRGAFSQYLSPDLVERLARDPSLLRLGGETRNLTLMFCDVRGFTTISERFKADPQRLTQLINRLLTPMTEVVLERRGTIDKYMGDCIMAFWNAPLDNPAHAGDACASALAIQSCLVDLNAELAREANAAGEEHQDLAVAIGINTGDCVVGNMGSRQRFDYSALGDTVNLASRLEGQSRAYGVDIVVGSSTRSAAQGLAAIELDLIVVKGKSEPERIHALLGGEDEARTPAFLEFATMHDRMLAAYRGQAWDEAVAILARCAAARPTLSALYAMYEKRIAQYRAEPPGAGWDGVFVARSK